MLGEAETRTGGQQGPPVPFNGRMTIERLGYQLARAHATEREKRPMREGVFAMWLGQPSDVWIAAADRIAAEHDAFVLHGECRGWFAGLWATDEPSELNCG